MRTPLEYLKAARELISDETKWCQGALRVDRPTGPAYCALGAFLGVEDKLKFNGMTYISAASLSSVAVSAGSELERRLPHGFSLVIFNNSSTYEEVISLFDDAIARLEELERGKDIDEYGRLDRATSSNSTQVLQRI